MDQGCCLKGHFSGTQAIFLVAQDKKVPWLILGIGRLIGGGEDGRGGGGGGRARSCVHWRREFDQIFFTGDYLFTLGSQAGGPQGIQWNPVNPVTKGLQKSGRINREAVLRGSVNETMID